MASRIFCGKQWQAMEKRRLPHGIGCVVALVVTMEPTPFVEESTHLNPDDEQPRQQVAR